MRLNSFALPAILAFFLSFQTLIAQLPWLGGVLSHAPSEAQIAENQKAEPVAEERIVKLSKGQNLAKLLTTQGLTADDAAEVTDTLKDVFNPRKLKQGQEFRLGLEHDAEGTRLVKLAFAPDASQRIELGRSADETYEATRIAREIEKRTLAMRGTVDGAFAASARRAGIPRSIANQMTRTLAYDVDFQRDIKKGDQFAVMFDAEFDDQGEIIRADNIQYIGINGAKEKIDLYRFNGRMYHTSGQDVRRAFLKTPVDGARVSSGFGMRNHPIMGYSAMHKGVDFAARSGTPIYAAGDGVVEKASWFAGYGNYVKIRHNGTYATAYGHMSRYGKGIRPGTRVAQGQVIGYVGSTGRSTGPHLHFEVHKSGTQVNPTKVASLGNDKLGGKDLQKFRTAMVQVNQQFAQAESRTNAKLAQNNTSSKALP
jgi:murein DD-endopeptidase MepM/ murein hydrolase activator NlpD